MDHESVDVNSAEAASKRKKEIDEKKKKLEELVAVWKAAMAKSEYILKYINHWHNDIDEYSYVVMEYGEGGDLSQEIQKGLKKIENSAKRFVYYYF
jgi:serine/threonine protein kinase